MSEVMSWIHSAWWLPIDIKLAMGKSIFSRHKEITSYILAFTLPHYLTGQTLEWSFQVICSIWNFPLKILRPAMPMLNPHLALLPSFFSFTHLTHVCVCLSWYQSARLRAWIVLFLALKQCFAILTIETNNRKKEKKTLSKILALAN